MPSEISNQGSQDGTEIHLGSNEEKNLKPGDFTYIMQIGKGSFWGLFGDQFLTQTMDRKGSDFAISTKIYFCKLQFIFFRVADIWKN